MSTKQIAIHKPDQFRFEIQLGEACAALDYLLDDNVMTIQHTFVPDEGRGKGIAGQLAKAAFDFARSEGFKVIPACSYIATYAKRFPEAGELVL